MKDYHGIKSENMFHLLVLWIWVQSILLQYIRAVIMRLPIIGGYSDAILTGIFIVILLASLPYYRITKQDLLFLLSVVIVFLSEWIIYKEGQAFIERYLVDFVLKILPLYVVGVSLGTAKNKENIIRQMYILSMVTLAADILYKFAIAVPMSEVASLYEGDMDRAYKLLPHCCLIAYHAIKKTNVWNVMFTIIGGLYLLMLGTRGAALIYLVMITLLLVMGRSSKWLITRTVVIFGSVIAFVASPLYDGFMLWMYQKAQQFGLSVRIFDKLMSGSATVSSGRDAIAETLLNAVANKPLLGYGICGDRVILNGGFAHNIAFELWTDFGLFLGSVALIVMLLVIFQGYRGAQGEGLKGLILSLIFASFLMMFLSGSILDESFPMFLLGLCVSSIRVCNASKARKLYHNT